MQVCTPETLETYLRDYGWTFSAESERKWHSGWQGDGHAFPLEITMSDTWIRFDVRPFMTIDMTSPRVGEMSVFLLELSFDLHLVKLSLDPNGGLVLSAQTLSRGFDLETLSDLLGVLGYYADHLRKEIMQRFDMLGYQPDTQAQGELTQ